MEEGSQLELPILDTPKLRKARGAFFTPPDICRYLAEWAVRGPSDIVLEPSCGEAAFLLAAARKLQALGATRFALHGVDLHDSSVEKANSLLAEEGFDPELHAGDFFEWTSELLFDAVIGNPPYVRYQSFTGSSRRKAKEAASAAGVHLNGLASSWAAFIVHASRFLKPEGRLGLVLPAELLTVNYAGSVRAFLLNRFESVRLIVFKERVFPGVSEEVVLLLAEGTGPTDHFKLVEISNVADLGLARVGGSSYSPPLPGDKWSIALLPDEIAKSYLRFTRDRTEFVNLATWGDPTLGMVSGNNEYFALSREEVKQWGIADTELVPISPPGSRHLRGLEFTTKQWETMAAAGRPVYLFLPSIDHPSSAARRYIAAGERRGINLAYKCRVRRPWWRPPQVSAPDLFVTYMNFDAPRLVTNWASVRYLNSVHGISLPAANRDLGMELLPLGFLNSLSLLGAELVGRSYGGGILKLEPKEAERLPVPSPATLRRAARVLRPLLARAKVLLAEGRLQEVVQMVDQTLLVDHLGFEACEVKKFSAGRAGLFERRAARSSKQ